MKKNEIEELAQLYDIEVDYVEQGQGGLYFTDLEGNEYEIDNIFDDGMFCMQKYETVLLDQCNIYSEYIVIEENIDNYAA